MSRIAIDRSMLLGFDDARNLASKAGLKKPDRTRLLGFDDARNLQVKVGKKPVTTQK